MSTAAHRPFGGSDVLYSAVVFLSSFCDDIYCILFFTMKRFISCAPVTLCVVAACFQAAAKAQAPVQARGAYGSGQEIEDTLSAPSFPKVLLRDVVVSNTDKDLKTTDRYFNSEPGIAIDPVNPRNIVVSAFSGAWTRLPNGGGFRSAPIWYSRNRGHLWTKEFAVSPPPGIPQGVLSESPCDETFDFGHNGVLYGTFLLNGNGVQAAARPIRPIQRATQRLDSGKL
jgi:hypothetical protein